MSKYTDLEKIVFDIGREIECGFLIVGSNKGRIIDVEIIENSIYYIIKMQDSNNVMRKLRLSDLEIL